MIIRKVENSCAVSNVCTVKREVKAVSNNITKS